MIELPGFLKRKPNPKAEKSPATGAELERVWQSVSHGKHENALAMVEKLIGHAEANRDAWLAKGAILEMLKRLDEARQSYEKAEALGSREGMRRAAQLRGC